MKKLPHIENFVLYFGITGFPIISLCDVVNHVRFPALKNLEIWRVQLEGLYWLAPHLQEIREAVAKQSEQASFTRL